MGLKHLHEVAYIENDPAPDAVSVVDMIKIAYENGLFKKLRATSHEEADSIGLSPLDASRLRGYFKKRPEFSSEEHNESGVYSVEFISDEFDIEIYNSFLTIYRLVD